MFGNRFFAAALLGIILSTAGGKIWAFEVTHKESRGENFEPRFEFRTGPRSVTIIHSGAGYPCCLRLDVEAKLEADRLTVGEIDNSPPCLCPIMPWVIEITVSDLAPGAYEVVLLGPTGKKLAAETVDVPGGGEELFRRGDVDGDGKFLINDAVVILDYLFADGRFTVCRDAADVNDDELINIADPVYLLLYLFAGGPEPPPPFPDPGPDPT